LKEYKTRLDEIEWLVLVYNTSIDDELKNEAYEELIAFGMTDEQIKDIFEKTNSDKNALEAFNKALARQEERNEHEKYTLFEMITIFLFGPYKLFGSFDGGLKELCDSNYKTKFRQRLTLLILGTIFWILLVVGVFQYYEYKRIQEIENTDISDWERNRIINK